MRTGNLVNCQSYIQVVASQIAHIHYFLYQLLIAKLIIEALAAQLFDRILRVCKWYVHVQRIDD